MKLIHQFTALAFANCLSTGFAFANVPIEDAAQLGKKTETSASTIKLVPIVQQHDVGRKAVNCAVTKPGKGAVKNPVVAPDAAAGAAVAQKYGSPAAVAGATGPDLAGQTLGTQTGAVVSGVEATQSTVTASGDLYRGLSPQVGSTDTIMAAFDMNSSIRTQNGLSWNQAISVANFWVQALNVANLFSVNNQSAAATFLPQPPPRIGPTCPQNFAGTGSDADPCRPASLVCITPASGVPACVTRRYVDSNGNVRTYFETAQRNRVIDPPETVAAGPAPITADAIAAALASLAAR